VPIATGGTTGSFTVTGLAVGSATVNASASGYANGSAGISVGVLGQVTLPSMPSVGLGQTVSYPIALSAAAPAGGAVVTLGSSDTTRVVISPLTVNIAAGATTPVTQPQITGVNFGSVSITGSSPGFTSGNQNVAVTATLGFAPPTGSVAQGSTQNLNLQLSGAAPASITVNLSSSNTSVATVPATVTIPAGQSKVNVPVTGVAVGGATIHASSLPNLVDTTASVTVIL